MNIRKAMVSGEKLDQCHVCYKREEEGYVSYRKMLILIFQIYRTCLK